MNRETSSFQSSDTLVVVDRSRRRRTLLIAAGLAVIVLIVAFMLMRAIPGDFAIAAAGSQSMAPEVLATIRRDLGLDQPLMAQYLRWLGAALTGETTGTVRGRALFRGCPVSSIPGGT